MAIFFYEKMTSWVLNGMDHRMTVILSEDYSSVSDGGRMEAVGA